MFSSSFFAADIISTVEFNHTGELLATGDKGGRVVIFQQEIEVWLKVFLFFVCFFFIFSVMFLQILQLTKVLKALEV